MSDLPDTILVLCGLTKEQKGKVHRVAEPIIIGRSRSCDVFIADVRSSRQQARFYRGPDGSLIVEDLGSLNGTFLNGKQISRQELSEGDVVRLGSTDFEVKKVATRSTVELVESVLPEPARVVKQISTVELPSLGSLQAQDYLQSIGVSSKLSDSEAQKTIIGLQQKTRSFATLFEISNLVQTHTDADEMLLAAVDVLLRSLGGNLAYVAMLNSEGELVPKGSKSTDPSAGSRFVLSRTVSRYVLEEQCAVIAPDVRNDARFAGSQSVILGPSASILAAPIIIGQQAQGLIALSNSAVQEKAAEEDLDLLCVVASLLGPALANIELTRERERHLLELEAANKKLLDTQEQLVRTEKMATIGRLSSGVIHEVKNHLSPLMLADMVAEQYPDDEDIQEMTEMVIEARTRILDLVDEIRMFARGDTRSFNMLPHGVAEVAERVIRFVRCDAKVRRTRLTYKSDTSVLVMMDADRIRQVLINLVQNAADAVHGSTPPKIHVRVYSDETYACFAVEDNGTGIQEDIMGRIFEPLFTTKGENGLGLGLDICRRIVKAHHGRLECTSEVGVGTTFLMELPLRPPDLSIFTI
jgi:signal transduction histidine kinase/pSer/pThr/pTyr-binding forkhead associated (FHA) protein